MLLALTVHYRGMEHLGSLESSQEASYGALGKFGELSRSELWGTWEVWRALKKRVMGHLGSLESSQEASYGALGKFGELSGS